MSEQRHPYGEPAFEAALAAKFDAQVQDVLRLSAALCSVPGITVPHTHVDFPQVIRTAQLARDYAQRQGLRVVERPATAEAPYPYLLITFAEHDFADPAFSEAIGLIGHVDVVKAKDPEQFSPYLAGVDLYARGATDMKTVDATFLVWMASLQQRPGKKPPLVLMLSCCEENASQRPHHTLSTCTWLEQEHGVKVRFAIVGERTGELEWMKPEPKVGPICAENRSWRWVRCENAAAAGLAALRRIAAAVQHGRTTIVDQNENHTPAAKTQRQPGVRSGYVNPFCFVRGERPAGEAVWVLAQRKPGAAIHSAAAQATQASLVEELAALAELAVSRFGERNVAVAGVEIGQDGNFNTYDGSGAMKLAIGGSASDAVTAWAAGLETELEVTAGAAALELTATNTTMGVDIRELLDHKAAVEQLLAAMPEQLFGDALELANNLPPWRCPDDHPDFVQLKAAYQQVLGEPTAELVKLHGNDGGHLAVIHQGRDPQAREVGSTPVVVFGQVGQAPHGANEFARGTSIRPYLDILDAWVAGIS